jgi:transaldolase
VAGSRLHRLAEHGQSVWIDYLSRDLLRSGALARMIRDDAVAGVTSNPTIFERALADTSAYDRQLALLAGRDLSPKERFVRLAARDVVDAADLLRPVGAASGGRDGWVSIEVDPHLAHDTRATIDEAERLHRLIDRPNVFVKIPATEPGLPAIEEMTARGRSINVTLIFSLARHAAVVDSYVRGLERFVAAGGDPGSVRSVASFFVSRVDAEADRRLRAIGGHDELTGTLAIANAKLAYAQYRDAFAGERWGALAARGARPQRPLWASTSVKDAASRDTRYVEELIGPGTISTMPEETIRAFQDHGRVAATLTGGVDEAAAVLNGFAAAGVDYDEVVSTLEREGIAKFVDSFDTLLARLGEKTTQLAQRAEALAEGLSGPTKRRAAASGTGRSPPPRLCG